LVEKLIEIKFVYML